MYLFYGEIFASLDDFDKGYFILSGTEVNLAFILSQSDDEFVLAVERCIEDRESPVGIEAVGVKTDG